ncbi:MAG: S-methyl-5-thioribose-1-phosphate isomerase [Bdellovibrionales bacterium]|nr:S-methyl-5-thioribose-1-phosphate isomerase [Bdellovibrionales bacterium]
MKNMVALSLKYQEGVLSILNQQTLPNQVEWLVSRSPEDMIGYIRELKTRGAPLIGVSASLALAQFAEQGASENEFRMAALALKEARPTAVNLMICIDRLLDYDTYDSSQVVAKAEAIFDEDVELCRKIAIHGASFLEDGDNVLTHCNTGGLATVGGGTALGVIAEAHRQGKKIHVYVDETRPLLQGGRLTTYELQELDIPYTLICDNMAASLMAEGKIQKAIVGADRIALNGDFANKIGTYGVAVLCHYHKVPFYVAAPYTTVDRDCPSGREIPIEQRDPFEVKGVQGAFGKVQWAPEKGQVYNPAFDVTPAQLVSGWVLDQAAYTYQQIQDGVLKP